VTAARHHFGKTVTVTSLTNAGPDSHLNRTQCMVDQVHRAEWKTCALRSQHSLLVLALAYFRQRTYKVNEVCRVGNWILCEDIRSDYDKMAFPDAEVSSADMWMCQCLRVCACVRACFLRVCFTPNNVAYASAGIFSWEYFEGHFIGSHCSLHYSIFCHQEHDYLSLFRTHTPSQVRLSSQTYVRYVARENCIYAQAPFHKGTTKQAEIKPNTFLTSGLNGCKVSVSRCDCFTPGVESLILHL
jgi:hypothetical protein